MSMKDKEIFNLPAEMVLPWVRISSEDNFVISYFLFSHWFQVLLLTKWRTIYPDAIQNVYAIQNAELCDVSLMSSPFLFN